EVRQDVRRVERQPVGEALIRFEQHGVVGRVAALVAVTGSGVDVLVLRPGAEGMSDAPGEAWERNPHARSLRRRAGHTGGQQVWAVLFQRTERELVDALEPR